MAQDEESQRAARQSEVVDTGPDLVNARPRALVDLLKLLAQTGTDRDRAAIAGILAEEPMATYLAKLDAIKAAAQVLEAHRAACKSIAADEDKIIALAPTVFAEAAFAPCRFTAAELQSAFEAVGFPPLGDDEEQVVENLRPAILHLATPDHRSDLARAVLCQLPELVAAGRFPAAWLAQYCAYETTQFKHESNVLLFEMFSFGYNAWQAAQRAQMEAAVQAAGLTVEEVARMGPQGLEEWVDQQMTDPRARAKMEGFMAAHPELRAQAEAHQAAMERDSILLLQRPDTQFLLLPPAELAPWLAAHAAQWTAVGDRWLAAVHEPQDEAENKAAMAEAIAPFLRAMARDFLTPEHREYLREALEACRLRWFDAGEQTAVDQALGAIHQVQEDVAPEENYFLGNLCLASLKAAIKAGLAGA